MMLISIADLPCCLYPLNSPLDGSKSVDFRFRLAAPLEEPGRPSNESMRPKGQPGVSQHPKFWWFLGVSTIFYFPFGDTTTWTRAEDN